MPLGITGWLLIMRFSHFGFLQFILEICFIYIIFQDRLLSRHFSLHLIAGIPTKKLGWSVCGVAFKAIIQLATVIVFLWFNQHFYWRERSIVRRIALENKSCATQSISESSMFKSWRSHSFTFVTNESSSLHLF